MSKKKHKVTFIVGSSNGKREIFAEKIDEKRGEIIYFKVSPLIMKKITLLKKDYLVKVSNGKVTDIVCEIQRKRLKLKDIRKAMNSMDFDFFIR